MQGSTLSTVRSSETSGLDPPGQVLLSSHCVPAEQWHNEFGKAGQVVSQIASTTHYSRLLSVVTGDPLFSSPHAAKLHRDLPTPSLPSRSPPRQGHASANRKSRNNASLSTWPLGAAKSTNCVSIQSEMRCFTAGWQLLAAVRIMLLCIH